MKYLETRINMAFRNETPNPSISLIRALKKNMRLNGALDINLHKFSTHQTQIIQPLALRRLVG